MNSTHNPRLRFHRLAFTLVEVLVAAAIGAVMLGALYQMFYAGSRINRDTMTKADALQAATLTLASVQQDLKQLVTLPVAKKASGEPAPRYGDHGAPVRISPLGRNISFYVPDKSAKRGELPSPGTVVVTYNLEPAETGGLFVVRRSESTGDRPSPEDGHVLTGVSVKDLKFRLLDPKSSDTVTRSPDQNYYVEAIVTGTDATGRETMTLTALTELEYPSTFQQPQNRNVNETISFRPKAPLAGPPDRRSVTKAELENLRQLRDLADRFDRGEIGPKELEKEVREVVNQADENPGRRDAVTYAGATPPAPLGNQPLTMAPRQPGQPIEFSTPTGDRILVPTSPEQVTNRVTSNPTSGDPTQRQNGNGQIRVTMTAWFAEYESHGGGPMQQTNAGSRSAARNWNFDSDAGSDFSAIHDQAMSQAAQDSARMLESFGIPQPR